MKRWLSTLSLIVLIGHPLPLGRLPLQADELDCLTAEQQAEAQLDARLRQAADAALDRRRARYESLETPAQVQAYQQERRDFLVRQLGGFPQRVPLQPQTLGTIQADGYRIEKVIYTSRPNHHITANLYLPDSEQPVPGIVVSSGHSRTAKTADYNQRFGIMMAEQGMAAICFDPIGQGERAQIVDASGQPRFGGTTIEHSLMGVGSILVGRNTASYRIWDAMRSIDYLESRPEIDAKRIGMTGCSGGGTLTSYVMALDERVACAAPACYLTTFRELLETLGPQDAEQNIYGQLAFGLDQPDYVLLRAPRPTLISSTTDDFFPIEGSWDTFRQAKRVYGKLGRPEAIDLVEIEGNHGVKPQNLATIAHWMRRWLLDQDAPVAAVELATLPPEQLICTASGQVLTMPSERSVFDLNADYEAELAQRRARRWQTVSAEELTGRIRQRLGLDPDADPKPATIESLGRLTRDGYQIEKLLLRTAAGVPLPALRFQPPEPNGQVVLSLHDEGKRGGIEAGGLIERLLAEGPTVVTVDLSGQGETANEEVDPLLGRWKTYFLGYLMGKSLVGIRTADALASAASLAPSSSEGAEPAVQLIGTGQAGIVALHAAALEPGRFASVTLRDTPPDWASTLRQPVPTRQLESTVHGALELYDLPDLERLAGAIVRREGR